jgi:hypothetical protein
VYGTGADGGAAAGACEPDPAGGGWRGRRPTASSPRLRPADRPPATQPHRAAAQASLHTGHTAATAAADTQTGGRASMVWLSMQLGSSIGVVAKTLTYNQIFFPPLHYL